VISFIRICKFTFDSPFLQYFVSLIILNLLFSSTNGQQIKSKNNKVSSDLVKGFLFSINFRITDFSISFLKLEKFGLMSI